MKSQSVIKWHGGKHYLAARIIELLPPRTGERPWHLWREPFAGGLAVTLALDPEGLSEAVNDLHSELSNFWAVLADEHRFNRFMRIVSATPFSEGRWELSRQSQAALEEIYDSRIPGSIDCIGRACRFFVNARQSRQGLMKDFATPTRRIRRGMNENVSAWLSAVEGLPEIHERLKRVEIRCMDAVEFIRKYDDPEAVFYCDPPYLAETRHNGGGEYRHEMTEDQHKELLGCLEHIKGRFLLSGYRSDLYDMFAEMWGWRRVDIAIPNQASSKKTKERKVECVWMNY